MVCDLPHCNILLLFISEWKKPSNSQTKKSARWQENLTAHRHRYVPYSPLACLLTQHLTCQICIPCKWLSKRPPDHHRHPSSVSAKCNYICMTVFFFFTYDMYIQCFLYRLKNSKEIFLESCLLLVCCVMLG